MRSAIGLNRGAGGKGKFTRGHGRDRASDILWRGRVSHNNGTVRDPISRCRQHRRVEALSGAMFPSPISSVISSLGCLIRTAPCGLELALPTGKLSEALRTASRFLSRAIRVNQIGSAAGHLGKAVMVPTLDVECDGGN